VGRLRADLARQSVELARVQAEASRAKAELRRKVKPETPIATSMRTICEAVAESFGVEPSDIRGRNRQAMVSEARQEAMRLMVEAGHSYPKIGRNLDGRDHSTIVEGVWAARARIGGAA
jgi:chromosomal replication initiation ATPase DnaA